MSGKRVRAQAAPQVRGSKVRNPPHSSRAGQKTPRKILRFRLFFHNFVTGYHLKPTIYANENYTEHGGGKSKYLTPEITLFELAAERGFAVSGNLDDITYDDSWESANQ